jgi:septal ring factor EnvC (AmiA/AmiB activator)
MDTKSIEELIDKWVKHDHIEQMPPIEVCLYECYLIDGLDWAAIEGATELAQLRSQLADKERELDEKQKTIDHLHKIINDLSGDVA